MLKFVQEVFICCAGLMALSSPVACAAEKIDLHLVEPSGYPESSDFVASLLRGDASLRDSATPSGGGLLNARALRDARRPQIHTINALLRVVTDHFQAELRALLPPALVSDAGITIGSNRIIGGAPCDSYPAVGALYYEYESGQPDIHCTATVVDRRTALTAAHCVYGFNIKKLSFVAHASPEKQGARTPDVTYGVTEAVFHTDYELTVVEFHGRKYVGPTNDIAVVYLDRDFEGAYVGFPRAPVSDEVLKDVALNFVGYGYSNIIANDDPQTPSKLAGAGRKSCVRIKPSIYRSKEFFYDTPGLNTCNGDSGGPAIATLDGKDVVIGTTSWGDKLCQKYGVDMRVDAYADWVVPRLRSGAEKKPAEEAPAAAPPKEAPPKEAPAATPPKEAPAATPPKEAPAAAPPKEAPAAAPN